MIRYSVESDRNDIIKLWHEAFGDSEAEIDFFLNNRYIPENTLVYETDSKIASMLFLLEGNMSIEGEDYPSYYLYAACTLNEYRGRGYMASLLAFAKETAQKRGYFFICLLPAEKALYDYYEKFGYKAIFRKKILKFSRKEFDLEHSIPEETCIDREEIRNLAFREYNYFKWDNAALNFAFRHNKFYGGDSVECCKGYALYSISKDQIAVKEFAFTELSKDVLSHILLSHNGPDTITVHLPADCKTTTEEYDTVDSGMIIAVTDEAESVINNIGIAYLGLTLD